MKPYSIQDRLIDMTMTKEEAAAFKAEREQYGQNSMLLAAQGRLEALREATLTALKSALGQEPLYFTQPIRQEILYRYTMEGAKPHPNFGKLA